MGNKHNTGFDIKRPRWQDYERFLDRQLCWYDGTPTHDSDGKQRQCPACRHKWSYEMRRTEFYLLRMFCGEKTATAAARAVHCARNTANTHYSRFREAAVEIARDLLRNQEDRGLVIHPTTSREAKAFEHALRPGAGDRQKFRACWILIRMNADFVKQMQMLFTREISPHIPRPVPAPPAYVPELRGLESRGLESRGLELNSKAIMSRLDAPENDAWTGPQSLEDADTIREIFADLEMLAPLEQIDRFIVDLRSALRSGPGE